MRGNRIITGCACAGAIALLGAGCGGSSSSSGALSRTELAAKVNTLCSSFVAQGKAVPVPSDFTTNPVAAAGYLDKLIALADPVAAQIKALKPDSSLSADFNAFSAAFTHDLDLLKTAATKAHAADRTGLATLDQETVYSRTVTRPAALKLGFTACTSA